MNIRKVILNLDGAKELTKKELKNVVGGISFYAINPFTEDCYHIKTVCYPTV